MLNAMKNEFNLSKTENGAVTFNSTGSDCLDLFSSIGALRTVSVSEINCRFIKAFCENPDKAMKILFYARDIRGGLGERKVFRTILTLLATFKPMSVIKNIENIVEFGRYDDLFCLMNSDCEKEMIKFIKNQFDLDIKNLNEKKDVSLLGKWLPSINTSNSDAVYKAKKNCSIFGFIAQRISKIAFKIESTN